MTPDDETIKASMQVVRRRQAHACKAVAGLAPCPCRQLRPPLSGLFVALRPPILPERQAGAVSSGPSRSVHRLSFSILPVARTPESCHVRLTARPTHPPQQAGGFIGSRLVTVRAAAQV